MAELNTIRTATGTRTAQIDAGLRAHMNKVYGTMSVGMIITGLGRLRDSPLQPIRRLPPRNCPMANCSRVWVLQSISRRCAGW